MGHAQIYLSLVMGGVCHLPTDRTLSWQALLLKEATYLVQA